MKIDYSIVDYIYSAPFYEDENGIKHEKEQTYLVNIHSRPKAFSFEVRKNLIKDVESLNLIIGATMDIISSIYETH